jgi:flagellar basal body P-ring formation protein FlgA
MPLRLIALALAVSAPSQSLDEVRARVAAFAGATPLVDPRLVLPACAALQVDWVEPAHAAVRVGCPAPAWQIYVPVQGVTVRPAASAVAVTVHRGDIVTVHCDGPGFDVAIEGVAETDGAPGGQIRVRNRATSEHILAGVGGDGVLRLQRYSSGGGGR